jgi:hypothetical protein
MENRSADASIRGYVFQFNKTISDILTTSGPVAVEGIEDLDIHSSNGFTAIQCKYLAAQKYSPSKVRRPLSMMLAHFLEEKPAKNYVIYAHFSDTSESRKSYTVEEIRECLKYREAKKEVDFFRERKIKNETIRIFSKRFELIFGPNIVDQEKRLKFLLQAQLGCGVAEACDLYYPRAFTALTRIASESSPAKRLVKKADFIAELQETEHVFNALYFRYKGAQQYLREIAALLKQRKSLQRSNRIIFLIGENKKNGLTAPTIAKLIQEIKALRFTFKDAIPWTFCLACQNEKFIFEIKSELCKVGHVFNDGGEPYRFNLDLFQRSPIVVATKKGKGSHIEASSFHSRVISLKALKKHKADLESPHVILSTLGEDEMTSSIEDGTHFYDLSKLNINQIRELTLGA